MIYLPSFQLESSQDDRSQEIRIACPLGDLLALCQGYIECDSLAVATKLLPSSPGLLVYTLSRFFHEKQSCARDWNELIEWMENRFFCEAIEYHSFESNLQLENSQRELLVKWFAKKSRKRTANYLAAVAGMDFQSAFALVNTVWGSSFELPEFADSISAAEKTNPQRIPIRHFWNACGKLQNIRAEFESQLLSKKLQAMKHLAYGASHEINNPLANIATRAQSLLTDEPNASRRQRLSVIYAQAIRAHEMISDMMLFAQPPDINLQSVEVVPLIEQVVNELSEELNRSKIVVGIRQYPHVENCELDSTQISVALKALLMNSIEAIGSDGEIRVQVWKRGENLLAISVADTGCGIEEQHLDQIFDPFFSGREAGRGLGFGLSKVWRIVDLHGGRIEYEGDIGWASRFVMSLPANRPVALSSKGSRIDNFQAA